MKTLLRSFIFILLVLLFSCEKTGLVFVKCSECTGFEPTTADLDIMLNSGDFGTTQVNIYEGNLEDNILYGSLRVAGRNSNITYDVLINKKYTITAEYLIDGKRYIAVDSAQPRVKYDEDSCDEPCYYIYDTILDLRLKYTK